MTKLLPSCVFCAPALLVIFSAACSGSNPPASPDASVAPPDAGPVADAGLRATCPLTANNPSCLVPADCDRDRTPQAGCFFCPAYNQGVCALGQCAMPELIGIPDRHDFKFNITGFEGELMTLVGIAVVAETSGGNPLTCAQVYAEAVDWSEDCYNVLDSRFREIQGDPAQTFTVFFSQFASGQKTLFVVYGFDTDDASGDPVGVTCLEHQVTGPGLGTIELEGDNLQRI